MRFKGRPDGACREPKCRELRMSLLGRVQVCVGPDRVRSESCTQYPLRPVGFAIATVGGVRFGAG